MTSWKCPEDVEKDLWLFSEINENDNDTNEVTPTSILQWNARIGANRNASIFEVDHPHENTTYVFSGRGRGGLSKIFKPGLSVDHCQKEEDDIKRRLRQVSGLGYSNELIEEHFRKTMPTPTPVRDSEFCDIPEETDSSFRRISPFSVSGPNTVISPKSKSSRKSTPSPRSDTPKKEKKGVDQNHPPPLSLILRHGKKKSPISNNKTNRMTSTLNPDALPFENVSRLDVDAPEFITFSSMRADAPKFECSPRRSDSDGKNSFLSSDEENLYQEACAWGNSFRNYNNNSSRENNSVSYRKAALTSANNVRDTKRNDIFDIKSDNDFPAL